MECRSAVLFYWIYLVFVHVELDPVWEEMGLATPSRDSQSSRGEQCLSLSLRCNSGLLLTDTLRWSLTPSHPRDDTPSPAAPRGRFTAQGRLDALAVREVGLATLGGDELRSNHEN